MAVCSSCQVEVPEKKKLCGSCFNDRIHATWKRQIRNYGVVIMLGVLLLMFDIVEVRALPHGVSEMPSYLMGTVAIGGLAVTGGLFGVALALFFSVWHKKKDVNEA